MYQIIEKDYGDSVVKYELQKKQPDGTWDGVYTHESLEEIRGAKKVREDRENVKIRVIE